MSYCNNCGNAGHNFFSCRYPITSFGIIAYRIHPDTGQTQYLMVRRRDTLGFVDFMRGKYSVYNKQYLLNMFDQMTVDEKTRLNHSTFEQIWEDLWGKSGAVSKYYKNDETISRDKLSLLRAGIYPRNEPYYNIHTLIQESGKTWNEAEWGFPKGRRNTMERDYDCAVREFCEETGYRVDMLTPIKNIMPFEETFTGSNFKSYKHKYYLTYMDYYASLTQREIQQCEIGASAWKTYEECIACIRPYNREKIDMLNNIHITLLETCEQVAAGRNSSVAGIYCFV